MGRSAFSEAAIRRQLRAYRRLLVHRRTLIFAISLAVTPQLFAQTSIPDWCRPLPRPEYKSIERVPVTDPWFEVYKPAPNVYAIYEPHQAEEVISYLIV